MMACARERRIRVGPDRPAPAPLLAGLVLGLAVVGGTLALAAVWTDDPPDALGKAIGTAIVFLLAADQTALQDLAQAAARAIRTVERDGRRAVRIDLAEPDTRQEPEPLLR